MAGLARASALSETVRLGRATLWQRAWPWLAAVGLCIPAWLLYGAHYTHGLMSGYQPTGALVYDVPMYAAYIREYADRGGGGLFYSNPFDPSVDAPRVYFHLHFYLLSVVHRLTGLPAMGLLLGAGAAAAVLTMRLAIAVYRRVVPLQRPIDGLGLVVFAWGGGLLMLAGLGVTTLNGEALTLRTLTRFDPMLGEWSLNLGRNLHLPTEAIYHALTLGLAWCVIARRYTLALGAMAVLALTHPFTGVQWGLIVTGFFVMERWFMRRGDVPVWLIVGCGGTLVALLGYYMVYLPSVPSHAAVMEQWKLPWTLGLATIVLGYGPMAALAFWRMRDVVRAGRVLASPQARFFVLWFLMSFGLANHEAFITPKQPIHFTRGYLWMPLFLLAAPVIHAVLRRMASWRLRPMGYAAALSLTALLVADNAIWFAYRGSQPMGFYLDADEAALQRSLAQTATPNTLLIEHATLAGNPRDRAVSYRLMAVTPARGWLTHAATTPHSETRRRELETFFNGGSAPEEWAGRELVLLMRSDEAPHHALPEGHRVEASGRITAYRIPPSASPELVARSVLPRPGGLADSSANGGLQRR